MNYRRTTTIDDDRRIRKIPARCLKDIAAEEPSEPDNDTVTEHENDVRNAEMGIIYTGATISVSRKNDLVAFIDGNPRYRKHTWIILLGTTTNFTPGDAIGEVQTNTLGATRSTDPKNALVGNRYEFLNIPRDLARDERYLDIYTR